MFREKMPEIVTYESECDGPTLVVSGAIHGNEPCGPKAIHRAMDEIANGNIAVTAGKVIFVPIANPKAFAKNKRALKRDLNRALYPRDNPKTYEDKVGNVLCSVLQQADVLLDLHSYKSQGEAFIFLGPPDKKEQDFARALGVNNYIYGWQDAFGDKDKAEDDRESQGTTEYTRLHGGMAVTLECGNHVDPKAEEVGFQAIICAMEHFNMAAIDPSLFAPESTAPERCIKMKSKQDKEKKGQLAEKWRNMSFVKSRRVVAAYDNGEIFSADEDGYIVFPNTEESMGEGWFYFGVESKFPSP